jgi:hypothetical protein
MAIDEEFTIIHRMERGGGEEHLSKNSIKPVCWCVAFPFYPEHFQRLRTNMNVSTTPEGFTTVPEHSSNNCRVTRPRCPAPSLFL